MTALFVNFRSMFSRQSLRCLTLRCPVFVLEMSNPRFPWVVCSGCNRKKEGLVTWEGSRCDILKTSLGDISFELCTEVAGYIGALFDHLAALIWEKIHEYI